MESYGRFAAVYDRLMEDMPYDAWVEFAEQAWRRYMLSKPERIVDLGCGTGNITLPLAARGYTLTGIDLSETMLAVAEQKAASAPAKSGSIRWLCQDMREWNAGEPADAVVSFCDCLNYITEEADVKRVFTATFRQLRAGGVFLFDVHHRRQFESYADTQPFAYDDDDLAYIWFCDYDEERREIEHQLTFSSGKRQGPCSKGSTKPMFSAPMRRKRWHPGCARPDLPEWRCTLTSDGLRRTASPRAFSMRR